ncbi:MAG: lactate racemase domain-containing protein [Candidatus Methylacidiphilales bacterium]|nr:lactate racemase domain-containing protein [Candidatus Methylacidiphilales bacterium]
MNHPLQALAPVGQSITVEQVESLVADFLQKHDFRNKRVLCIVPDGTRTAPLGRLFRGFHARAAGQAKQIDLMIALGTHPAMTDAQILQRMEWTPAERHSTFASVRVFNHTWDQPETLRRLGTIPAAEISDLSGGLFAMDVPVDINARVFDYDILLVMGPVFPHEVVGFSGGNKYFFPGIGGAEILNFFHWLGAVVTNPMIIGNKWTPVRKVVDRAAALIPQEKLCLAMVVDEKHDYGLFGGDTVSCWDAASDLSARVHITYEPRAYRQVLSCAPPMYDELWVAGKCMYKLEPVLADGAELIIYAPHLHEVSLVHGKLITEIGYHCRDYFLKQWDRFKDYPWGVLAHSTHVHGIGTYENGVETPRARVVLATGIPEEVCRKINLGYRDPASIRVEDFRDREEQGILYVPKAGERLYHQAKKPLWAGGQCV